MSSYAATPRGVATSETAMSLLTLVLNRWHHVKTRGFAPCQRSTGFIYLVKHCARCFVAGTKVPLYLSRLCCYLICSPRGGSTISHATSLPYIYCRGNVNFLTRHSNIKAQTFCRNLKVREQSDQLGLDVMILWVFKQ